LRSEIEAEVGALGSWESAGTSHPAPGMHRRHYSPRAPLSIDLKPAEGRSAWVWWNKELPAAREVRMPADATSYASKLYEVLHMLDGEGWERIVVEAVPETVEWEAVRDRLTRAASREP
jgi:L-threonylcarbamoyladenylate synthase